MLDAIGPTPSASLARQLFATGKVGSVHIYGNIVTVDLAKGYDSTGLADIVGEMYRYWKPGVEPPSFDDLQPRRGSRRPGRSAVAAAMAAPALVGGCQAGAGPPARTQPSARERWADQARRTEASRFGRPGRLEQTVRYLTWVARTRRRSPPQQSPRLPALVPARDRCFPVDEALAATASRRRAGARPADRVQRPGGLVVGVGAGRQGGRHRLVAGGRSASPRSGSRRPTSSASRSARVVLVDADAGASVWAERVAAAADGFELIVTCPPAGAERVVRRVAPAGAGARRRDGGGRRDHRRASPAISSFTTTSVAWEGIGQGAGHLMGRRAPMQRCRAPDPAPDRAPSCCSPARTAESRHWSDHAERSARNGSGAGGVKRDPEAVPRLVTVWCADWPLVAARVPPDQPAAVFHANRVVACTPAARAVGVAGGDRRRLAQRICPELHGARPRPRPRRARVRADRAGDRRHGAAARGRRAGLDVRRRPRPGALLRWRPGRWRERFVSSRAPTLRRRRRYGFGVGIADGRSASAIAARLAAAPTAITCWWSHPVAHPAFVAAALDRLAARAGRGSTPTWSTCSPGSACARWAGWRRSTPATCWRGSARSGCMPTASPVAPTCARRPPPTRRPSGGSSIRSTSRSSSSRRSCSWPSGWPTSWSPGSPPTAGCACGW